MSAAAEGGQNTGLITATVMAATIMSSLDSTIANVALPHIQGSVSAGQDQITWVLTSYIVAAAIMTPLTGWAAGRFGRKRVMQVSIIGFTIASVLCGLANNLIEIVGFRLLQGVFGAALVPISQVILLDIHPREKHGQAMAIWGMGAMLGPIVGPALGGWLTENLTWRWVFFINVPVGILAFLGFAAFLREKKDAVPVRLDFFGFGALALGIGALQLMLDRGQQRDWFTSTEICIEAGLAILFLYLFTAHILTAKKPFVDPALFANRNFVLGSGIGFFLGVLLFSVLALLPPMMETLMGYPVVTAGLVTAPRGIATLVSMTIVGRLSGKVDPRYLMVTGMLLTASSMYMMSGFSLQMGAWWMVQSAVIQGLGTGLVFVPMATIAFATLDVRFRNEGSAMFTLIRNIGSSIGISAVSALTIRNGQIVQSRLVEGVRPDSPTVQAAMPGLDFADPDTLRPIMGEIARQAAMVSHVDTFWLLLVATLCALPMILFMRPARGKPDAPALHLD
jgi:DHA2 family multidrug resistance protein